MSDELLEKILLQADGYIEALPPMSFQPVFPPAEELSAWIDHTILKADATAVQVRKLCAEALQYHFASVCVNPVYVALSAGLLQGSDVKVCSVVGFPLGASVPEMKAAETHQVIHDGATEIDMVINIGALKNGDFALALHDVQAVVEAAKGRAHVKVILEMCYLDQREKIIGCLICKHAGADFVKTSTGFGAGGAVVEDVALMRRVVGPGMGVKAAGGIKTLQDAKNMILAGASRIGASAGVSILKEAGVV